MRQWVFAFLVAVPTALVTWIVTVGTTPKAEPCPSLAAPPAPSADETAMPSLVAPAPGPAAASKPGVADANAADALLRVFAKAAAGATVTSGPESYDAEGLFSYINGGAPAYLDRGFARLVAAELSTPEGGELSCDIYDMTEARNAAAMYDAEAIAGAQELALGDAARQSKMALAFVRGRYYVQLTAFDAEAERALPAIAKAVAERLL